MVDESRTDAIGKILARMAQWYNRRPARHELERKARAWTKGLAPYDLATIAEAITLARRDSRDFMPTLPAVEGHCAGIVARRDNERNAARRDRLEAEQDAAHDRYIEAIPPTRFEQDKWIDDALNDCERLGRLWSVESKNKKRRADFVASVDTVRRRVALLLSAIGRSGQ